MKILITGGRSDIAKAFAKRRHEQGDTLIVTSSTKEGVESLKLEYEQLKIPAQIVRFNLADAELSPELILSGALDCDALVLNAATAVTRLKRFHQFTQEEIVKSINENVTGNVRLVQAVIPWMVKRGFGRLVFVSSAMVSSAAAEAVSRYSLYCLTKSAMEGMFLSLASEYKEFGILANIVRPGITKTERTKRFWSKPDYLKKIQERLPIEKLAEPEDVAEIFDHALALSDRLNGQVLRVQAGSPVERLNT